MMSINFGGVCNTLHPVIPAMRQRRRGQLALMSSLAALRGLPYSPAYCASKAALKAYGEALRAWLHSEGIEVTVVLPGFVDTALAGHVAGPKPFQMTAKRAADIDAYLERGGGLVYVHWAVDGQKGGPEFAKRIGLAAAGAVGFRHGPLIPPPVRRTQLSEA